MLRGDELKAIFRSARPGGALGTALGYGFPSGHSTGIRVIGALVRREQEMKAPPGVWLPGGALNCRLVLEPCWFA